jgi:hypothetical protein
VRRAIDIRESETIKAAVLKALIRAAIVANVEAHKVKRRSSRRSECADRSI